MHALTTRLRSSATPTSSPSWGPSTSPASCACSPPHATHLLAAHTSPLTHAGKLCLLTELCDTSLYDVLKDETRPLSVASMVGTLRQIALGVYYLHCCRPCVLHLDLKSANVLLDRHGVAKV